MLMLNNPVKSGSVLHLIELGNRKRLVMYVDIESCLGGLSGVD